MNFNETIYKWIEGGPDNKGGHEDCVHLWHGGLNDMPCDWDSVWGKPLYGMCEIMGDCM